MKPLRRTPAPVRSYTLRHENLRGSGDIDPLILNLSTRWKWSASRPGRIHTSERTPMRTRDEVG
jgi:hypothetical protein